MRRKVGAWVRRMQRKARPCLRGAAGGLRGGKGRGGSVWAGEELFKQESGAQMEETGRGEVKRRRHSVLSGDSKQGVVVLRGVPVGRK